MANKLTTLLIALLLIAVAVAGYMTYKNHLLVSADRSDELATLSEQIATLQANNEKLSADLVSTKSRHAEQLRGDIETLKQNMGAALSEKDEVIQQLRDTTATIQLDSDVTFKLGSAQLSASGKTLLSKVTQLIEKYPDYLISLEGHTDNIPIKTTHQGKFPSNWELSAARAASAARFLESQGIASLRLRVVGYGLSRPVGDNDSAQSRAQNRRLEIRFSPKPRIRLTP